jgi:RecB family exonuclease
MNETLIVLPSARAIRERQLSVEEETLFLPNYITMSDFISKLTLVEGYKFLDEDSRILLLLEASNFQNFSLLQIERNFFTFTKNSSYIFKFFEELSAELYNIENLKDADVYAEYDEHITILQELYKRYEILCSEQKLLDRIFLPKLYTFNEDYLKNYTKVEILLEGYLTNFELQLLQEATAYCEVVIRFTTTRFNLKMQKKFFEVGFELAEGKSYLLSLNSKEILEEESSQKEKKISCISLSEPILQIAFIKQKIYEFIIEKRYEADKIALILPNESVAESIRSFDNKLNLNFAMGRSFKETLIYKKLHATIMLLDDTTFENIYRLEREGDKLFALFYEIYKKPLQEVDFLALLEGLVEDIKDKQAVKIFQEELHSFSQILPFLQELNFRSALNLFMQRLAGRSIDDIGSGKITVMGVLETRSVHFDAVIIIDFDERNVPKRSDKDMFLNSQLREIASLPTMQDRENLQKHYYEMLLNNSKEVAISYVASSENRASHFLKELGIKGKSIRNEMEYASLLFQRSSKRDLGVKEIVLPYSFKEIELSASRLRTFLSCKRKYYYNYVVKLRDHEIPRDMPQEYAIGNDVHKALENLYAKREYYDDVDELQHDLALELDRVKGKSELEAYLIALKKRELVAFSHNEIARFKDGWRVKHVEKSLKVPFHGITIQGKIDRIDMKKNLVSVVDYKTGSYTLYNKNSVNDATDFQLEFYYILAGGLGNVEECSFYDLKEGKLVKELFLEEKLAILGSHISDLLAIEEVNFELCEDTKECQFCPYTMLCGRD